MTQTPFGPGNGNSMLYLLNTGTKTPVPIRVRNDQSSVTGNARCPHIEMDILADLTSLPISDDQFRSIGINAAGNFNLYISATNATGGSTIHLKAYPTFDYRVHKRADAFTDRTAGRQPHIRSRQRRPLLTINCLRQSAAGTAYQ